MPYEGNEVVDAESGLTEDELDEVEAEIGQSLPQSLREHYAEYNGGQLENTAFSAPDGQTVELHAFLVMSPDGGGEFEETYGQARVDPGYLPGELVPFAIGAGGGLFCVSETPDSAGAVFFYDPEEAGEAEAVSYLAASLRELIEGMV